MMDGQEKRLKTDNAKIDKIAREARIIREKFDAYGYTIKDMTRKISQKLP